MKQIFVCVSCLILFSCTNRGKDMAKLQDINDSLITQIDSLTSILRNYNKRIVVIPEHPNPLIHLGEEYLANVFLSIQDDQNPIELAVYEKEGNSSDTLKFETTGEIPLISIRPQQTGKYIYEGIFKHQVLGEKIENFFYTEFEVIE